MDVMRRVSCLRSSESVVIVLRYPDLKSPLSVASKETPNYWAKMKGQIENDTNGYRISYLVGVHHTRFYLQSSTCKSVFPGWPMLKHIPDHFSPLISDDTRKQPALIDISIKPIT